MKQDERETNQSESEYIWTPNHLDSRDEIDAYVDHLKQFIQDLIAQTVPLAKNSDDHKEVE